MQNDASGNTFTSHPQHSSADDDDHATHGNTPASAIEWASLNAPLPTTCEQSPTTAPHLSMGRTARCLMLIGRYNASNRVPSSVHPAHVSARGMRCQTRWEPKPLKSTAS
eukprot:TRINITY_DN8365_c0_g1_i1.p2 TRINITY_DN8365_c0_g1~~TRINITY_DN8365_c0_g1_i1.p2  ORF type:complete len:110 (-),score=5.51 TRINITY_DN8365_c0_g1_i1:144-473(-)